MTLLLTKPFTEGIVPQDDADRWALMQERALREMAWRQREKLTGVAKLAEITLAEMVEAHDAGDVCHVCSKVVTWTDHLPPLGAGGPVRCFVALKPGERRVGDAVVYSAEFLSGPKAV